MAVMLGIRKVCSIPSQKSIFLRLTLAGCSLVAAAIWELIPVRPKDASPGCRTHRPAAPFVPLCGRVTGPVRHHGDTATAGHAAHCDTATADSLVTVTRHPLPCCPLWWGCHCPCASGPWWGRAQPMAPSSVSRVQVTCARAGQPCNPLHSPGTSRQHRGKMTALVGQPVGTRSAFPHCAKFLF